MAIRGLSIPVYLIECFGGSSCRLSNGYLSDKQDRKCEECKSKTVTHYQGHINIKCPDNGKIQAYTE